jgi:hypothetical protein
MKSPDFVLIDQDLHQSRPRLSQGHVIHAHLTYGITGEHTEVNSHKQFPQTWGLNPTNTPNKVLQHHILHIWQQTRVQEIENPQFLMVW